MQNDRSLGGGQFLFDLDSPSGVMQLLAAVRASTLTSQQKNELRDLVFSYANGGHDPSVKITIQQKVTTHGIAPLKNSASHSRSNHMPAFAFGTSRPAPAFRSVSPSHPPASVPATPESVVETQRTITQPEVREVSTEVSTNQQPINVPGESSASQPPPPPPPPPTPEPPAAVVTEPAVVPSAPPEVLTNPVPPAPATTPNPQPAQTVSEAAVAPVSADLVAPPAPVEQPPVSSPSPEPIKPAASVETNQYLQRIREIKSLVNQQVGNPVNLVDIDNEVGREYMAALLDAMKKINSGSAATSAMGRLESAFVAVEETLSRHAQTVSGEANSPATPAAVAAVADESTPTVSVSESAPTAPAQPLTVPSTPQPAPAPAPINSPGAEVASEAATAHVTPERVNVPRPEASPEEQREQRAFEKRVAVPAGAPAPVPEPAVRNEYQIESGWGPATDTVHPDVVKPAVVKPEVAQTKTISSVGQSAVKPRTPNDLPAASAIETSSVAGDPLYTKEVDTGLNQLLVEWSLFKKSGLFGTGPKGSEHPLFVKIKGLQIPLLLAGRFEGATQEIKQSITDYMNGWRYEQGIIYEQGETFEHYLRRVIRHILDLQKGK